MLSRQYYFAVAELTVRFGDHLEHDSRLLGIYSDICDARDAYRQAIKEHRSYRVYFYEIDRCGWLSFLGVADDECSVHTMINYGRSQPHDHGRAILEAYHTVYLEEVPPASPAEEMMELAAEPPQGHSCVDGCGSAVYQPGQRCEQCQQELGHSSAG